MTTPQKQADFIPANRRISVCAKRFYAALQFISHEETRYYLNGVFIEPHKDGGVIMAASDGHTLAAVRDNSAHIAGESGWICSVPKGPFIAALKRKSAGTLHFVGNSVYLTDAVLGQDATDPAFDPTLITAQHNAIAYAKPVDGTFPDWRRLIPSPQAEASTRIVLDGKHFNKFNKAISALADDGTPELSIAMPRDMLSPIVIQSGRAKDFFGLVMPMREHTKAEADPAWLKLPAKQERKPAPANDAKPAKAGKNRPALGLKTKPVEKPDAA
ncbi:hypothetical protein [Thalassospira sp. UBA1131]|uniref:hypothetical protein n=1 Tax=Thalassospira sp. UBA1131 TaxID=1947672 RepID=UPI0025D58789|nr:hypothetical protein [Thalassospira sp. UBA1131]